ncbi:MAG: SgcJ/EcaC family oxidoreductase [Pseudomonadota bacterium]
MTRDIAEEMQRLYDQYVDAYRAENAAGCASIFTDDAEFFSPFGQAARGQTAIEATHIDWLRIGGSDVQVKVVSADAAGDLAWCLAEFSGASAPGPGTVLSVLQRQSDGGWRIRICSLNSDNVAFN